MSRVIARYKVKPDRVEENEDLVRAVYTELEEAAPEGFSYRTYLLDDGVSFVHVADLDDGREPVLTTLGSFRRFQEGIGDRCVEGPEAGPARLIGSYGDA
jgi:hypothetical protein